jgi:hypothetical protein
MPIVKQSSQGMHYYTEDDGATFTTSINFAPGNAQAQVSLSEVDGEGLHRAGIEGYSYRTSPTGADIPVDFGDWPNWKSLVGIVNNMTRVTWGLALGAHQEARARLDILWWG